MSETCSICKRLLDDPKDPTTENCGGDCLRCMAEFAEDPDCMTPYIRILKTENKYLRHDLERQMTIANEHVNEVERWRVRAEYYSDQWSAVGTKGQAIIDELSAENERLLNLLRDCNTESISWLDARDAALDQSK